MSKRRRASELMFKNSHGLKYPVNIVAMASGTGTCTKSGVLTVVAAVVATRVYVTLTATNVGAVCGTA